MIEYLTNFINGAVIYSVSSWADIIIEGVFCIIIGFALFGVFKGFKWCIGKMQKGS